MSHSTLTPEKEQEIITKVIAAVEIARSQGIKIVRGTFGLDQDDGVCQPSEFKEICPMAALLIGKASDSNYDDLLAAELGIQPMDPHCIIRGIDRHQRPDEYELNNGECTPWHILGAKIADIVWPPAALTTHQGSQSEHQS